MNLAIVGAGGHTRSSLNLIEQYFKLEKCKIYDNNFNINEKEDIFGVEIVGKIDTIANNQSIFLSIGDNSQRTKYFLNFADNILKDNLIHSRAIIEKNVSFGIANQVFAFTFINSGTDIGSNNIINTNAIIEHEVVIGSHNHISVGVKICGRVKIGNLCTIGAGAIVIDKINICDEVIIGAGSVVISDIKESGTYVGVPARKIK